METFELQKWDLEQRLKALDDELNYWRALTLRDKDFHRHNRQVQSFIDLLSAVRTKAGKVPVTSAVVARERSKVVLGMFRIWEFLRSKLAQRREARFLPYLPLADEYAWHCYKPIYDSGLKEPPLVYLNGGYSPYTLTRSQQLQAESVPRELIQDRSLNAAMASLPFPVIGVPWYQIESLADLPVIGHEVGHSVEADLGLTGAIVAAVSGAVSGERSERWKKWSSEIFADVYGCLGCGPAFVSSLAWFLSTEDAAAQQDNYPPNGVRFLLNLEVLRSLGYHAEAEDLSTRWKNIFPVNAAADYAAETPSVAAALLDKVSAAGAPVRGLIPFVALQKRAYKLAEMAVKKDQIEAGEDVRALAAAYRLGFDMLAAKPDAEFRDALPRLDRLKNAMTYALNPDLRAGETEREMSDQSGRADYWLAQLQLASASDDSS